MCNTNACLGPCSCAPVLVLLVRARGLAVRLGVCLLGFPAAVCAVTLIPTIASLCNTTPMPPTSAMLCYDTLGFLAGDSVTFPFTASQLRLALLCARASSSSTLAGGGWDASSAGSSSAATFAFRLDTVFSAFPIGTRSSSLTLCITCDCNTVKCSAR